jgi:REP element-mobilizing transposase RayT
MSREFDVLNAKYILTFASVFVLFIHMMDPTHRHHRRSIRLKGYDYSRTGAYFVTICTQNRDCIFGNVVDGAMVLNDAGMIAGDEWVKSANIRVEIEMDVFVVMPNHLHGIVIIQRDETRRGDRPVAPTADATKPPVNHMTSGPRPGSIGSFVAGYKSAVTRRINHLYDTPGRKIWQRNYYERIIRNQNELKRIREYIINNPQQWEFDRNHPAGGPNASRLNGG